MCWECWRNVSKFSPSSCRIILHSLRPHTRNLALEYKTADLILHDFRVMKLQIFIWFLLAVQDCPNRSGNVWKRLWWMLNEACRRWNVSAPRKPDPLSVTSVQLIPATWSHIVGFLIIFAALISCFHLRLSVCEIASCCFNVGHLKRCLQGWMCVWAFTFISGSLSVWQT